VGLEEFGPIKYYKKSCPPKDHARVSIRHAPLSIAYKYNFKFNLTASRFYVSIDAYATLLSSREPLPRHTELFITVTARI
jgi:hypothetical protein